MFIFFLRSNPKQLGCSMPHLVTLETACMLHLHKECHLLNKQIQLVRKKNLVELKKNRPHTNSPTSMSFMNMPCFHVSDCYFVHIKDLQRQMNILPNIWTIGQIICLTIFLSGLLPQLRPLVVISSILCGGICLELVKEILPCKQ